MNDCKISMRIVYTVETDDDDDSQSRLPSRETTQSTEKIEVFGEKKLIVDHMVYGELYTVDEIRELVPEFSG